LRKAKQPEQVSNIITNVNSGATVVDLDKLERERPVQTRLITLDEHAPVTKIPPLYCQNEKKTKVYFTIKELGIKILVDKSRKDDLIYKYEAPNSQYASDLGGVTFGSRTIQRILGDQSCLEWGVIRKVSGTRTDVGAVEILQGSSHSASLKEFDSFFIFYTTPQATCFTSQTPENIQKK
jgi:hypothetical protein